MKNERLVFFLVPALALGIVGCGETIEEPEGPVVDETPTTQYRPAALEEALPADGAVISGELVLIAHVDTDAPVEVRFMLNTWEMGVVNEAPYALELDRCELSVGNHFYVIELIDSEGHRDHIQQWFTVEPCD
jgi:hypothetical protein